MEQQDHNDAVSIKKRANACQISYNGDKFDFYTFKLQVFSNKNYESQRVK